MVGELSIPEKLERVQEGDYLLWNGRTVPQPVTNVGRLHVIVEGNQGGRYKFYTNGPTELKNLNSDTDYDIDELTVLRPLNRCDE